jgi:two-component system nitrate/nitrite response regulator NarL
MTQQPSDKIRILVVDDHALFRQIVAQWLAGEPDFEVVAHCGSVPEALTILDSHSVDIILLDLDLGGERGSELLPEARQRGFTGRIVIVAAGVCDREAAEIMRSGAVGIFLKQSSPELLSKCIRKTMAGELWLDQHYVRAVLDHGEEAGVERTRREQFTEREREVLRGVLEGLANKEIGSRLHLSETSVKAALQQLFHKTGVRTRSQLVRAALEQYRDQL